MKNFVLTRGVTLILHVFFWVGYGAILYTYMIGWARSESLVWGAVLSDVFVSASISYFNLLILLPRLYERGKYSKYFIVSILLMVVLVFLRVNVLPVAHGHPFLVYNYFIRSVPIIGFYLVTTVGWFFNHLTSARRREVELRNNQLDSELKFLKLQLSPHFMFNTLNNIYSMAYFRDVNTPAAILKLSGMMRHMLIEEQDKFISLAKEITFIENFIELWRLKLDEKPTIEFIYSGVAEEHRIAPLIFLVFLENAFKHGNTIDGKIIFSLTIDENDLLHFSARNDIMETKSTLEEKSGIGLSNVQKRLNLMYPGKHQLTFSQTGHSYEVNLKIELR
jgi:sensor histidine kinase YesM